MRTLTIFTILFFECIGIGALGQAPNWAWAKGCDSSSEGVSGAAICTDVAGNIYATGELFGTTIFGNDTLTSPDTITIFIVKYKSNGDVIWAKRANENCTVTAITTDINGNIYITGYFGEGEFGNGALVAKYDANGNMIWTKNAGGLSGSSISADKIGNVYITGNSNNTDADGGYGIFIIKFDSSGNDLWNIKPEGGYTGNGISVSPDGYIYASGDFNSSLTFGNITITGTNTITSESLCTYLVKLDQSGNVIWAETAGDEQFSTSTGPGYSFLESTGLTTDGNGNCYITGNFNGTLYIGGSILNANISSQEEIFIAKFDSFGNVIWAEQSESGANEGAECDGIIADKSGNSYITGSSNLATLGNFSLGGNTGSYVAKLDANANVDWVAHPGGSGISVDANENVYITGGADGLVIFGNDSLYTGGYFVAKLGDNTTGVATLNNPLTAITVYPNPSTGNVYFKGVQTGNTLQVYNVLGEEIYTSTVDRENYTINLTGKAKGMYFYRAIDIAGAIQKGKIVLE